MDAIVNFFSNMTGDLAISFQILVLGWGGIFIVMVIIYIISMALAKFFPPSKEA